MVIGISALVGMNGKHSDKKPGLVAAATATVIFFPCHVKAF